MSDQQAAQADPGTVAEDRVGDWVQSNLNWRAKLSKGKVSAPQLTDFHRRCLRLLTKAFRTGIYNISINWIAADWHAGRGVMFTLEHAHLSTYDFDHLSRLVIGAHDECIRVDISPCSFRYLRIYMHPREREGGMALRHPTIEQAIADFRDVPAPVSHDTFAIQLDTIRRQVDGWVAFNVEQRAKEGLASTDETHLIAPPCWPSHGVLRNWSAALAQACAAVTKQSQAGGGE